MDQNGSISFLCLPKCVRPREGVLILVRCSPPTLVGLLDGKTDSEINGTAVFFFLSDNNTAFAENTYFCQII